LSQKVAVGTARVTVRVGKLA
jgi:hypothetical protein